ncbi:MAG: tetratricopeptide repeat protein [Gallionella sp.]
MMRYALMLALLVTALPAQADSNWERLWFNADQRGEKLLQHGDAGAAARVYKDPRHRAYAEMKTGDFRRAASELDKFHDSDSEYNRGNALAKLGDLKDALDAYDTALKSDPKNHDAQHNRDLVEKALKQQQQQNDQQQNGQQNGQNKDDKSGSGKGSNSGGQGSQTGKNANSENGKSGQQSAGNNSAQSGKSGSKSTGANSAGQQNARSGENNNPAANGSQAQQNPQKNPGPSGPGQSGMGQPGNNANAQSGQDRNGSTEAGRQQTANGKSDGKAAQARKDAEAGLAANKPGINGNPIANAAPADQTAPLSEQQLSKEQWLRSIPDDPGGLLRRKFMIEYMLRQQKAQQ